jgi:hypothetical protein
VPWLGNLDQLGPLASITVTAWPSMYRSTDKPGD